MYLLFSIRINSLKWNQPGSSEPPLHPNPPPSTVNPLSLCQPHLLSSTQRINYAEMNLTRKFLRWPPLRVCECQAAALERDSWPDLCMALGWPPAAGRGTWLGGTRSETWRSCRRRRTGACEASHCIPCCTPCPAPPARTVEAGDWQMSRGRTFGNIAVQQVEFEGAVLGIKSHFWHIE